MYECSFTGCDKNKMIGKIENGELTFNIYSVKGTDQFAVSASVSLLFGVMLRAERQKKYGALYGAVGKA